MNQPWGLTGECEAGFYSPADAMRCPNQRCSEPNVRRMSLIEASDGGNHRFVAQVTVYSRALGVALTVKTNQPTLCRQISSQFEGKRHIPFTAMAEEKRRSCGP